MPTDHFNYHIKALLQNELIEKDIEGYYSLTTKGKQFSSNTDIFNLKIEKQSRIHLTPAAIKKDNGVMKYLIHKRKKHPYFGWQGFPSGKAKWGNTYETEVIRELEEETGVTGKPTLKIIKHFLVTQKDTKELLEDKLFLFYRIDETSDTLQVDTLEGEL